MITKKSNKNETPEIGSVLRALDVVEYLYEQGGSAGINEISNALGMYKSTVHRVLNTLKTRNYIFQSAGDSKYHLGLQFVTIGMMLKEQTNMPGAFRIYVKDAAAKYNECIQLTIPDLQAADCPRQISIQRVNEGNNVLSIMPSLGTHVYSHCSASGKCLLAFADPEQIKKYDGCELKRFTEHTITDWSALKAELEQVRARRYATDIGELEIGLMCIAVPVFADSGDCVASISILGPISRIEPLDRAEVVKDFSELAKKMRPYA